MEIHCVKYSSQPYVYFCCTNTSSYVSINQPDLPEGVYKSDDGLYTFDKNKSTCNLCLNK